MIASPPALQDFVGEYKKYWNGTIPGKVIKESLVKEESHVDVSTRAGNHSRGNGACGASSVPERDFGHAVA
jgi:hypothetical protein